MSGTLSFKLIAPVRMALPTKTADANGNAQVSFGPPNAGEWWRLQEMSVSSTSQKPGTLTAYLGGMPNPSPDPADFHSATLGATAGTWSSGGADTYILENEMVTLVWAGLTPGAECFSKVHYQRLQVDVMAEQMEG